MIGRIAFESPYLRDALTAALTPDECSQLLPANSSESMQTSAQTSNPRFVTVSGELLCRLRVERGMTQLQLAKAAGYTERLVRKAEKGGRLDIRSIQNLAEALSQSGKPVLVERLIQDDLAIARLWVRSFDTLGLEMLPVVESLLSDRFTFHSLGEAPRIPFAGTFDGASGVGKWLQCYLSVVAHRACEELEFLAAADSVVARWMEHSAICGVSCRPFRTSMCFRFRGGLIDRIEHDYDTMIVGDVIRPMQK